MLLMLDNFDSFTYNLVQYFRELGADLCVKRNDISLSEIKRLKPEKIVVSPGPCSPNEAGVSLEVIRHYAGVVPILGVCLGHQAIAQSFGAKVVRAKQVMHGKTSGIYHNNDGVFKGLAPGFKATRYHSLTVDEHTLPDCFDITAWTQSQTGQREYIMGIRHKQMPLEGVQFHPEAILTEFGHQLLQNFLDGTQ
ncbi:aminodeoxychorismate/anthranilate synthase component II [Pleionea sp. CnH1-48]|uniref:anthranilate synthase component II n=1 Tax=Pleionea sp. CnH1-48 TaxID=2954494 RepID=UPI002097D890|nr:aminodeoxychorismate/anthranilate synthase component II [Pleionea sp. CnH1-48]MCO7224686.1 aminodeoxychorismate/anthranilate synthase component II [Pleionea sp. CnH1-48]